jgi:hypothetical protein
MNTMYSTLVAAGLAGLATFASAIADDLAAQIAACAQERDDARRLACFDRVATANVAQPQVDGQQTFGIQGSELARRRDAAGTQVPVEPKRIDARVAGIDKRLRGELVLTLDNGQVWAQKDPGGYFPVKVGDAVTVVAGTLGSFRLAVGNRNTAVTRVR